METPTKQTNRKILRRIFKTKNFLSKKGKACTLMVPIGFCCAFRDDEGNPQIGFSFLHPKDTFNRKDAERIAINKSVSLKYLIEQEDQCSSNGEKFRLCSFFNICPNNTVTRQMNKFYNTAKKYFKL